mgnify:FL=1
MPLWRDVDVADQPDLDERLLALAGRDLGDRYAVSRAPRLMVPDVIVMPTPQDAVALQVLRRRRHGRRRVRVFGVSPPTRFGLASPLSAVQYDRMLERAGPVVDEVAEWVRRCPELQERAYDAAP